VDNIIKEFAKIARKKGELSKILTFGGVCATYIPINHRKLQEMEK
jgi:hypothetical protein